MDNLAFREEVRNSTGNSGPSQTYRANEVYGGWDAPSAGGTEWNESTEPILSQHDTEMHEDYSPSDRTKTEHIEFAPNAEAKPDVEMTTY